MDKRYISRHAKKRSRQRLKKRRIAVEQKRALVKGIPIDKIGGEVGFYLRRRAKKHNSYGILWQNEVYWYRGNTLITLYGIPQKYHQSLKKELRKLNGPK